MASNASSIVNAARVVHATSTFISPEAPQVSHTHRTGRVMAFGQSRLVVPQDRCATLDSVHDRVNLNYMEMWGVDTNSFNRMAKGISDGVQSENPD
jgi:hypothetical protein